MDTSAGKEQSPREAAHESPALPGRIHSDYIIDSHVHVLSGYCTPLPLIWKRLPAFLKWVGLGKARPGMVNLICRIPFYLISRMPSDILTPSTVKAAAEASSESENDYIGLLELSIERIARRARWENQLAFGPKSVIGRALEEDRRRREALKNGTRTQTPHEGPFTPMIIITFDLEYAHLCGFEGKRMYSKYRSSYVCYDRKSWAELTKNVQRVPVKKEDLKKFKTWHCQWCSTVRSAVNHPWQMLPLYFYEPRRWNHRDNTEG